MGTKGRTSYKIWDPNALHYLTFSTVEWVDIFTKPVYKDILADSLQYCIAKKGLVLHSYVIMTNHLHLIAKANEGYEISNILRDFKRHTAKFVIKELQEGNESRKEWILDLLEEAGSKNKKNKTYQLWRQDNHPIVLFSNSVIEQKLVYIHNNPVEAGFVFEPHEYKYSSAVDYAGGNGMIDGITLLN